MYQQGQRTKIGLLGGSFDPIHQGHLNIAASACEEYDLAEVWFIPAGHSPNKNEAQMTPAECRARMVSLAIQDYPQFKLSRIELDAAETSYTYRTLTKLVDRHPDMDFYFIMGADSLDYFEQWRYPQIICEKAVILVAARDSLSCAQIREKAAAIKRLFPARIYPLQGGYTSVSSTMLREQISSLKAFSCGKKGYNCRASDLNADHKCHSADCNTGYNCRLSDSDADNSPCSEQSFAAAASAEHMHPANLLPPIVAEYIKTHGLYGCQPHGQAADDGGKDKNGTKRDSETC